MASLRQLGWSLVIIGLVVLAVLPLYEAIRDDELRRESFIAATAWQLAKAAELDRQREHLSIRRGVLLGVGLALVGFAFLEIRRRVATR
jgi:hypothetical protein